VHKASQHPEIASLKIFRKQNRRNKGTQNGNKKEEKEEELKKELQTGTRKEKRNTETIQEKRQKQNGDMEINVYNELIKEEHERRDTIRCYCMVV
jgi:hypothetical protein